MKYGRLIVICLLMTLMVNICFSGTVIASGADDTPDAAATLDAAIDGEGTGFTLSKYTNEALPGQELEIALNGKNLKNLYAYEAVISFDPAVLEFEKAESKLEGFFITPKAEEGQTILAFTKIGKQDGEEGDVPLCTVVYRCKAGGDADIGLVSVKALDPDLTVTVFNGTSTIRTFSDLEGHDWARMQIETLASLGIIKGTSKTTFSPGLNVTRADFICLLVRALKFNADVDSNFDDVPESSYFYREVGIARKLGIIKGVGGNRFLPREPISRQDMMVCVSRALEIKGEKLAWSEDDLAAFSDHSEISRYAVTATAQLVREGIIVGSRGRINPKGKTTRAEAAVVIYRILNIGTNESPA